MWTRVYMSWTAICCVGLITAVGGVSAARALGAGDSGHVSALLPSAPSSNPTVMACMEARKRNDCNPDPRIRRALDAANPEARVPVAGARLMSRQEAIRQAGGLASGKDSAAQLMQYADVPRIDPGLGENGIVNPARWVWIVSVNQNTRTRASPAQASVVVHGYTDVIDAQTGIITDACAGCTPLLH